jgi:predicted DNA-binding transcriptional regulator AlpA
MVCVGSSVGPRTGVSVSCGSVPAVKVSVPRLALPSRKNVESLADSAPAITCESCPHAEHGGKPSRLTSLLRVGEVAKILRISRSTIYAQLQQRSDELHSDFPRPIRLNAGPRSSVRWRADDIQAWIDSRHRAS